MTSTTQNSATLVDAYSLEAYERHVKDYANTHNGAIGQQLITGILATVPAQPEIDKPDQFTRIRDPKTQQLTNIRRYEPRACTADEDSAHAFLLPLLPADALRLMHDQKEYTRLFERREDQIHGFQDHDAQLTIHMHDLISPAALTTLKSNPAYTAWTKSLAVNPQCFTRSLDLLTLIKQHYTNINSALTVAMVSKFFNQSQSAETTAPEYLQQVARSFTAISAVLESSTIPDHVYLPRFHTLMLLSGLDRTNHASLRAIEIYLQNRSGATALDHPDQLNEQIIAAHLSDLSATTSDPISQQSSAYAATTSPKSPRTKPKSATTRTQPTTVQTPTSTTTPIRPPGVQIPGRTNHCSFCLEATSKFGPPKYFYHLESMCARKKASLTPAAGLLSHFDTSNLTDDDHFNALLARGWSISKSDNTPPDTA